MRRKPVTTKTPADQVVKDIPRATCKLHPSEQMIRIVWSDDRAPTGAVVCWHQPGPSCDVTPLVDGFALADRRRHRGQDRRADPFSPDAGNNLQEKGGSRLAPASAVGS